MAKKETGKKISGTPGPKPISTMDRIDRMEKAIGQLQMMLTQQQQGVEYMMQKAMAVEQSYASLAKTTTALIAELVDTKQVDDQAIMKRIRGLDEQAEKERVASMLAEKVIAPSEVVGETSLLAIKQVVLENHPEKGTRETIVANYRLIEMAAPFTVEETKAKLIGLKIGGTVTVNREEKDGVISTLNATVLEIYDLAQGERQSEEGTSQEGKDAPPVK